MRTAFGELQPGACHQIGHNSRNNNLAGLGLGHDASGRVHSDAADVLTPQFDFAGM